MCHSEAAAEEFGRWPHTIARRTPEVSLSAVGTVSEKRRAKLIIDYLNDIEDHRKTRKHGIM
jgi:hypothetical protein